MRMSMERNSFFSFVSDPLASSVPLGTSDSAVKALPMG